MGVFWWNSEEEGILGSNGDSSLVKKFSNREKVVLENGVEVWVRTFFLWHHKAHKLPELPTVVFIHGLGGQLNQFEYLFDYFSHFSTVLSVDLPGHGQSDCVADWDVYSQHNLLELLLKVIDSHCEEEVKDVVLVAHSMGSVLATKLAGKDYLGDRCKGIIAICPPVVVDVKSKSILPYIPEFVFNIFRSLDRQGGLESKSIRRMVVSNDPAVRKRQLRCNLQVKTAAWLRTAYGFVPASEEEWKAIHCPLYLLGAEKDEVTPPDKHISTALSYFASSSGDTCPDAVESTVVPEVGHSIMIEKPQIVCGLIGDFVTRKVDQKLSLAWQLGFLASKKDKWSLKNESKWKSVQPASDQIEGSPFRAIKTLRQDDSVHNPAALEANYPDLAHIIDISRETPPYEPLTFKRIKYHKFPTVSKIPPTESEVDQFIQLVDDCLTQTPDGVIAVHCHYGFNRTGFFIVCYMIQKLKFGIKDSLDRFAKARPPGIKHIHFRDELYVRYDL